MNGFVQLTIIHLWPQTAVHRGYHPTDSDLLDIMSRSNVDQASDKCCIAIIMATSGHYWPQFT